MEANYFTILWWSFLFKKKFWPHHAVCMYTKSLQSCSTLLRPHGLWPSRLLCPLGFSRQEYWSGLLCPSPGDLPDPGIELKSLMSAGLAGILYHQRNLGSPQIHGFSSVAQSWHGWWWLNTQHLISESWPQAVQDGLAFHPPLSTPSHLTHPRIKQSGVVQQLRFHLPMQRGAGLIPGWGTKISHAMWHGQK